MMNQDISGAGGAYDIVGALATAVPIANAAVAQAVKSGQLTQTAGQAVQNVLSQVPRVVQNTGFENRHLRRQIAPFPITKVVKGTEQVITIQPQRGFRFERMVLQSDAAGASKVVVTDISIGATPQFITKGALPLSFFAFNAVNTSLRGDTATPGITITITLLNLDTVNDETITGGVEGEAVDS